MGRNYAKCTLPALVYARQRPLSCDCCSRQPLCFPLFANNSTVRQKCKSHSVQKTTLARGQISRPHPIDRTSLSLAMDDLRALNSASCVAGIHYQLSLFYNPLVVVIGVIRHDQDAIVLP